MKKSFRGLFSGLVSIFLISMFVYTGCENFLSGSALVEEMENAIGYANASMHPIRIRADENTGTITSVRDKVLKVTDEFDVGFQPAKGYKFLRWEAVNLDDTSVSMASYVQIEKPEALETKVKLIKETDTILLKPLCEQIFEVTETSVSNADTVYCRNTLITVTFNNPVGLENDLSKISITITGLVDAVNYFTTPVIIDNSVYFFAKSDNLIPVAADTTRTVTVTIPETFYYNGQYTNVTLDSSYTFSYVIDSTTTEKASVVFSYNDEVGTLKVDGTVPGTIQYRYSIGQLINLTYKKSADYYFNGWVITDSDGNSVEGLALSYPENDSSFGYDETTGVATATILITQPINGVIVSPSVSEIPKGSVTMQSSHGRSNPLNADTRIYREKNVNNITFEADNGFSFTKWIAKNVNNPLQDVSEYISIENPDLPSTSFIILKEVPAEVNLVITPDYIERGEFISGTPTLSPEGSFRDAPIQVMFDHDMDTDSIYYTDDELSELRAKGVTSFKTTDIKGVTKYYGYTMNGQIFYKNITITNFTTGSNLLASYGAPYFSTPKVLMIPTAYIQNEDSRTILAPPAGTQIMVTVNANCFFRDEKYNKPISMKSSKIWTYLVNTRTDSTPPTFTVNMKNHNEAAIAGYDQSTTELTPVGTVTEYSKIFIQDKLLRYSVAFSDTGCGLGSEFIRKVQKVADSSYNPISPLPEAITDTISIFTATPASYDYSPEPMDLTSYDDGIYEISFEMADQNNNIGYSETAMRYFFLLDSQAPNVEKPQLESLDGKIKLVWDKCEETDFSRIELKVDGVAKSTDISNPTDITTYDESTKKYTKEILFKEGTKHSFEFNFYDLAGNNKQYVITKNTIPGKVASTGRNTDIGTSGNEITVNWNYPDTTEDINSTYSKARIFYTTGSNIPSNSSSTFVDVVKKDGVTSDSYKFENLSLGTTYNFVVYALDDEDNMSKDAPAYVTKNTQPNKIASKITGTSSIVSDKNQIKLDWTNPAGNVAKTVLYYGNSGENFTENDTNTADSGKFEISGGANAASTQTIPDLKQGKKYYFNLYIEDAEAGNKRSEVTQFSKNTLPGEVQSASVSYPLDASRKAVKTKIKVDWTNPDTTNGVNSTYTKARIYYSGSGAATTSSPYVDVTSDTTSYTFESLALGTTYNFKVYAVDDEGNLSPNGFNAGAINTQPNKITSYTLNTGTDGSDFILVRWTRPEGNVASIKIRYGKQSDLSDAITYDTAAAADGSTIFNQNAKILHGMTLSSTYYFQLIAVDALGNESEPSEINHRNSSPNKVTGISTRDANGTEVSVGAYNSKVKINWTNPAGTTISKVRVYYKQSSTFTSKNDAGVKSFDSVSGTSGSAEITPSVTTMVPGYKYYIKVAAIDNEGNEGPLSTESVLYTVAPAPIGISEVVPAGTNSVTVKWEAPAGDAGVIKYELYYGQNTNSLIKANLNNETDTFATITGLVPGTYYYRVNMDFNGIKVEGAAMSGGVIRPQEPVISAVTVKSSTSVEVTWTKVNNINGYKLYYGTEDDFTKMSMTSFGNSQVKTTVNSLTPGTTYYFRLVSWSGSYTAPDANNAAIGEAVTATTTPAAASITSVNVTSSSATINWSAPSSGSYSGFKILYSKTSDAIESMSVTAEFATTARSGTLGGLIAGTRYYFRIVTYTGAYTSPTAANASVSSSFEKYTKPNAPTINSVTTTTTSATVTWSTPLGSRSGYYLYYGTTNSVSAMTKYSTNYSSTATSATITGLTAGKNYYFRVVAYAGTYSSITAENSAYSDSSSKYTVTNKVTSFSQTASSTTDVTVSWTYGAGEHINWDMYKKDITAGDTSWTQGSRYSSGTGWYAGGNSTVTSTTLTGLTAGHHYKILIYVSDDYWNSSVPDSDCTIIDVYTRPNAVTFAAAASSYYCNDITVSWTNPSGNYDGIKILYSTDNGANWYVKATYTNKTTTTYTGTNFTPGTSYLIKVASYVDTWNGMNQYNVNTNTYSRNAYTIPDCPTHILAYRTSKRSASLGSQKLQTTYYTNLSWTAPTSGDYDGYYLYYGTDPAAVKSATASSSVTKVTIDKTETSYNGGWNTSYYYKLVTYKVLDGTTYESPTFYNETVKKSSTASKGDLRAYGNIFYSKYFTSADAVWNTTLSAYYFKMTTPDLVTRAYIELTKNDGNSWYWTNHAYTLNPSTEYGFYMNWDTPGAGYTHAWLVPSYTYNTNYIFRGFMTSSSPIEIGTSTFGKPSSPTSQMSR